MANVNASQKTINKREAKELDVLTDRYEKLNRPGFLGQVGNAVVGILPQNAKSVVASAGEALGETEYFKAAMGIVAQGFGAVEKQAARMTIRPEQVIARVNSGAQTRKVNSLEEICTMRSYEVARIANSSYLEHMSLAFFEGAATGVPGFAGIPFNIVLSTFLYFRAVQSMAMFYGYDVHADPAEMVIASDVLMETFGAHKQGPDESVAVSMVGKIMVMSEANVVQQTVRKGWTAMANRGGVELLITQTRALAHASAKKALQRAGKSGLEKSVFAGVFAQLGRRLTQKTVQTAVPVVGGVFGALFDSGMMDKVLNYAEIFYHKRFILEKDVRIRALTTGKTVNEVLHV